MCGNRNQLIFSMSIGSLSTSKLLDVDHLLSAPTVTLIRDGTDANDSIPFALHLARTITSSYSLKSTEILFLTSRSITAFSETKSHSYPVISRDMTVSLTSCTPVDPHPYFSVSNPSPSAASLNAIVKLIRSAIAQVPNSKPRLLILECIHALKFAFSVDPSALTRVLTSSVFGLAVVLAAPFDCGVNEEISDISAIADNIIDLSDLRTGVATEIDGLLTLTKFNGQWIPKSNPRRYKVTQSTFNITS